MMTIKVQADIVGIWQGLISLGDCSIPAMTKRKKPTLAKTFLKSAEHSMTIFDVVQGQINDSMTHIKFTLGKAHGMTKTFTLALDSLVRFYEDDQGRTNIVIKRTTADNMFHGHNFAGQWVDPVYWNTNDIFEHFNPQQPT